jgi:hypothetical protein
MPRARTPLARNVSGNKVRRIAQPGLGRARCCPCSNSGEAVPEKPWPAIWLARGIPWRWHVRVKGSVGNKVEAHAAILVAALLIIYLAGYLVLRQRAFRSTIFITGSGRSTPRDYREIHLGPATATWVHRIYWPMIVLDRKWSGTVVTVNIP